LDQREWTMVPRANRRGQRPCLASLNWGDSIPQTPLGCYSQVPLARHNALRSALAVMIRDMAEARQRRARVVIAKPGLDGHDRGAKVIARALRDAGMEVVYTGLRQSPEQIVAAAAQEDADVVGLSILSGAHLPICRRVVELLRERGMESVRVFVGGIIPSQDIPELKRLGVAEVFLPGASTRDVIRSIEEGSGARV